MAAPRTVRRSGFVLTPLTLKREFAVLVFAAVLLAALDARAAPIVYDQPAGAGSNGAHVSSNTQRVADDFLLGVDTSISDIHWWGFQLIGPQDVNDFQITFYNNNAGAPGTALHTSGVTNLLITPVTVGAFDSNFYSADLLSAFSASAATTYWVSIFNQVSTQGWFWIEANAVGNGGLRGNAAGTVWTAATDDMAFQLTGTPAVTAEVPEPATLSLLGLGLAGAAVRRRMRRR